VNFRNSDNPSLLPKRSRVSFLPYPSGLVTCFDYVNPQQWECPLSVEDRPSVRPFGSSPWSLLCGCSCAGLLGDGEHTETGLGVPVKAVLKLPALVTCHPPGCTSEPSQDRQGGPRAADLPLVTVMRNTKWGWVSLGFGEGVVAQ
jgi:hypothetical protein